MKKKLLIILGATSLFNSTIAQQQQPIMHPCGTVDAMEEAFKTDPELKKKFEASQAQFEIEYQKALSNTNANKITATTYTIPIVFHIMGPQVVTDQVIINFVDAVNRDYARLGSDTGNINPAFKNLYVDAGIRVALAKKDPTGKCTNGIIRHNSDSPYWTQNSPNYAYSGTGTNKWPPNQYLNVYIVDCIASTQYTCPVTTGAYLAGYTYVPGSAPSIAADAIVYLRSQLGQNSSTQSRVLSHEIGHWLNLRHTFGNSNNAYFGNTAAPAVNCGATILDDLVGDTPETKGYFSICPSTYSLDCTSLPNIENIMDYSSCTKMFTQGQVTRMRAAIISTTASRNNLWTAANYDATGLTGNYTCTPVADLKTNRTTVCEGQTITYTDMSQVGTSGTLAWTFEGGTPSTSTATSVVVTYPSAGNYSVSLIATNSIGTNTLSKTSYVTVTNGASGVLVPNAYDFETAGLPTNMTVINSNSGTIAWSQNTAVGANLTAKSIYLDNASVSSGGNLDIFETPIYDFSNTTNVSLSFWYSYAKKIATQADTFKVQYSLDCGGIWTNVLGVPSLNTMAINTGGTTTTPLVPTTTQWKQVSIPSGLLTNLNLIKSVKFRFYFRSDAKAGSSNNIYIDEINLTGTVGINELEKSLKLNIYPNPTNSSSNVDFTITGNETIKISLTDIIGRKIEESSSLLINGKNASYIVNKNGVLAKGVYIINIDVNNQRISKKLIIE